MRRGQPTKLGRVLLIVIVVAVFIGALVWAGRALLGGNNTAKTDEVNAGQKLLDKPTDQMAVRMSVRGPIVATENHYSIVMTISQTNREIVTFRGYDGEVIQDEKLGNNQAAFRDFLAALNRAGFMQETLNVDEPNQGICAIEQLITFEVLEYQHDDKGAVTEKSAKKLWTTSCPDLNGNFAGLVVNVEDLFIKQIPDARAVIDHAKNVVDPSGVYRDEYDTGLGAIN